MQQDMFNKRKQDILSKQDKSSKQSWDKKIAGLCDKINKLDNYYTTSSCAGRVVILVDQDKKAPGLFEFVSHDLVSFDELRKSLHKKEAKLDLKFKQESCILHIACRSLKDAEKMLGNAKLAGLKRSGIISSGKRFVVEMVSTEKLEFPIVEKGKILIDDNFLKVIVKKSNSNLKKTWEKIEKLGKLVK